MVVVQQTLLLARLPRDVRRANKQQFHNTTYYPRSTHCVLWSIVFVFAILPPLVTLSRLENLCEYDPHVVLDRGSYRLAFTARRAMRLIPLLVRKMSRVIPQRYTDTPPARHEANENPVLGGRVGVRPPSSSPVSRL